MTSRTASMVAEVSASPGPVVGIAVKTTVSPSAEVCGSLTETMPGSGDQVGGQLVDAVRVDARPR